MAYDKLEPRLRAEIDRARSEDPTDRAMPVIIEHAQSVQAPASESEIRVGCQADLEARVYDLQRGIIEQLEELGASDIERSFLSNSISAWLNARGIESIAEREDVRLVRLNRLDQVTC